MKNGAVKKYERFFRRDYERQPEDSIPHGPHGYHVGVKLESFEVCSLVAQCWEYHMIQHNIS